jgi:SAM-dependent methyltransferase
VGNVLGHYYDDLPGRTVVDRYEVAADVENVDVLEVGGEWDYIVAISTLEHVRWDEQPREAAGAVLALEHLRSLLAPAGRMLVTVPMGWHETLDSHLLGHLCGAVTACTLVRAGTGWVQSERPVWRPYGVSQPWAEAVWIGEFVGPHHEPSGPTR